MSNFRQTVNHFVYKIQWIPLRMFIFVQKSWFLAPTIEAIQKLNWHDINMKKTLLTLLFRLNLSFWRFLVDLSEFQQTGQASYQNNSHSQVSNSNRMEQIQSTAFMLVISTPGLGSAGFWAVSWVGAFDTGHRSCQQFVLKKKLIKNISTQGYKKSS